ATDGSSPSLDVTGSFSDPDTTDTLTFSAIGLPDGLEIDENTGTISGTVSPNASDEEDDNDGTQDYTITVTATDDLGATATQTFTYTINNVEPEAVDDSFTTTEDVSVTGNVLTGAGTDRDGAPDSDDLTVLGNTDPSNGDVVVNADGTFTYTPNANFVGTDTFIYTISDGNGGTDTATVTITVNPDAPINSGTPGDDIITGDPGDGTINPLSEPDVLFGFAGNDTISGLGGNDTLDGGPDNDLVTGGSGNDRLLGGTGNDTLLGGNGNDRILAGSGNDVVNAGSGNDNVTGGTGKDTLFGGLGNDRLLGEEGNDLLIGGGGRDTLTGGLGRDTLTGGRGETDIFRYASRNEVGVPDTITDFEVALDRIHLRDLSIVGGTFSRNISLTQRGNNTLVSVRLSGTDFKVADLLNVNAETLDSSNFIL
ncbi:MAG: Ig-like domain-containing protein, partial [Cyanobacteria bacterium P01_E01_bin.45]